MRESRSLIPSVRIQKAILALRGQHVMLDEDLAQLYGVKTKVLVQAVKRNIDRFPEDFMFQLSAEEFVNLRSQIVTSSAWGGRRYPPFLNTSYFPLDNFLKIVYNKNELLVHLRVFDAGRLYGRPCCI